MHIATLFPTITSSLDYTVHPLPEVVSQKLPLMGETLERSGHKDVISSTSA